MYVGVIEGIPEDTISVGRGIWETVEDWNTAFAFGIVTKITPGGVIAVLARGVGRIAGRGFGNRKFLGRMRMVVEDTYVDTQHLSPTQPSQNNNRTISKPSLRIISPSLLRIIVTQMVIFMISNGYHIRSCFRNRPLFRLP